MIHISRKYILTLQKVRRESTLENLSPKRKGFIHLKQNGFTTEKISIEILYNLTKKKKS